VAVTTVSNEKKVVSEQPAVSSNQLATETAESTARLKLVSPTESTNDNPDISPLGDTKLTELTEQLTLAQETIENQSQENIDIKARMEAMEEQIETLRRLLSLKDPDLARLQDALEESKVETPSSDILAEERETAVETVQPNDTEQDNVGDDELATTSNANVDQTVPVDMVENNETALSSEPESEELTEAVINTDTDVSGSVPTEVQPVTTAPEIDAPIAYVANIAGLDVQEAQSKYDELKSWVSAHKMEAGIGGLLLLLIIWLIVRVKNRPYQNWDDAVSKK
jgi:pilus assembly protein FimV